ncbi:zinc finger protein 567-like [Anopheles merus]|uniref:C2H2-type domain-containing protein n=1 Tax=Anopheles merus TaxID=30066 RepID=A0A182UYZ4_ANOME|nr:zinc finger protein 567-like [Anopheles merus]
MAPCSTTDHQHQATGQQSEQAMEGAVILDGSAQPPLSARLPGQCAGNRSHRYKCDHCEQTFKRRDELDRHRYTHTGVHAYPCLEPDCGKAYSNRSHLLRHVRACHLESAGTARPEVDCSHPNCAMKFTTRQAMKRHYQTKHVLGKPYACDTCGERFWRKLQLKLHKVRHTGEYPHRCEHCGQGFVNARTMRSHRCRQNAHRCPDCAREFLRWSELVVHRRLDHPTQYRCDQCDKQFSTKRNLNLHGRVHRKQQEAAAGQDGEQQQQQQVEVLVYECPYPGCPRFYEHERNLHAHVRSKHESRKREELACPVADCGKVLATKQKLEQHRRLHLRASKARARASARKGRRQAGSSRAAAGTPAAVASETAEPAVPAGEPSRPADVTTDSEVEGAGHMLEDLLDKHVQHLCSQLDTLRSNLAPM